jgi:hypothetical protein
MEYRSRGLFATTIWGTLDALLWVGVIGISYNVFKPNGWSYQFVEIIMENQPTSYYCLAAGLLALLVGKRWLDTLNPNAVHQLLSLGCSFAGSYFIIRLLLPV